MPMLPPSPQGVPPGSSYWNDWYEKLRTLINSAIQNHNDLLNIQGGSPMERYHLTNAEYTKLSNLPVQTTGTFTPVLVGTTAAGVGTYTAQSGRWVRQGNLVYFNLAFTWTAHTGTGNMQITGLPYNSVDRAPVSSRFSNITYTGTTPYVSTTPGSSALQIAQFSSAGAAADIPIDTAGSISAQGVYYTTDP